MILFDDEAGDPDFSSVPFDWRYYQYYKLEIHNHYFTLFAVLAWRPYPEDRQANVDSKKELFIKDVAREVGNEVQL